MPAGWKLRGPRWLEKELLRRAFDDHLPEEVVRRRKQKFSQGAGSAGALAAHANETISDAVFGRECQVSDGVQLRSKEELLYYRIFHGMFGDRLDPAGVGRTRSITRDELN